MLGSLAKWLRILGFDTLYFRQIDDNEIIKIAKQDHRILLTGDNILAKSKKIDSYILINSNDISGQLREVLKTVCTKQYAVGSEESAYCLLPTAYFFSRCIKCNGELVSTDRKSVASCVPEHVFLNFHSFLRCMDCGKIYWEGSHKKMMDAKIKDILAGIKDSL